jgi:eukaryotic-like serine/threonine-protein kinase
MVQYALVGSVLPRLERYEISNEIGHGGMATVYRALDKRLERWVAVKVMHPHLRGTDEARARFAREAHAVARLRHPGILEIYDYSGSESDEAYIATELLTGPTLKAFVDSVDEVPAEVAACVGVELARALAAAHAEGIVHRDVKPENILLHQNAGLKLTDFGIADMVDPSVSHFTATGQILGSPSHMAPEQVEGGETDGRSDVFAVGTILYWLATGKLPFSGKNPHQVLKRVADCNPVDPLIVRPSIGAPLRAVILRCLRKEPSERYQTAEELAAALMALLTDLGVDSPKAELARYFADPKTEAARLRSQVLERLLEQAQAAVAQRDRPGTIARVDRVLALDDGNARALALLGDLDRRMRTRLAGQVAVVGAALVSLVGLWFAFTPAHGANSLEQQVQPRPAQAAEVGGGTAAEPAPGMQLSPSRPEAVPEAPKSEKPARPPAPRPRSNAPRTVVFAPVPANVTISVDGGPAQPFGPSFRMLELPPGVHTFRFVGAHQCCDDAVVQLDLPPGPGETVVPAKLTFRDARLYVASNVPADVSLDGEAAGRALSLISVPLNRGLLERRKILVTAAGHEPYTGYVELRAGQVAQLEVTLLPSVAR